MSTDFLTGKGLGLSLSGMRVGPIDPSSKAPKVGFNMQYQIEDPTQERAPKFYNKERSGFSGGFKIPEEQRKAKLGRKIKHVDHDDTDDIEDMNKNDITKDEIMQHLSLGTAQAGIGSGKHGTGSKTALTKDLIENLEKELEKLRRTEENIKVRKHIALGGDRAILDETEEDRQNAKNEAVKKEMKEAGNQVIFADQKRIQLMRHRVGQLDSVKSVPFEELEAMRTETAERLQLLEEQYWGAKDAEAVGPKIAQKYKAYGNQSASKGLSDEKDKELDKKTASSTPGILKNKKKAEQDEFVPKFDYRRSHQKEGGADSGLQDLRKPKNKSRSKSAKNKKSVSPEIRVDPRQQIYEAKFEKYLANKKSKDVQEKKKLAGQKEGFDIYTKGPASPSKYQRRFKGFVDPVQPQLSGKYHKEDLLDPDHDEKIIAEQKELKKKQRSKGDPFADLGVNSQDKMTFFLLKWVFNAIKRDSAEDDPKFKGNPYVSKNDLIKQLSKNPEILHALGYQFERQLADSVKLAAGVKEGYLQWNEFMNFFFLKDATFQDRIDGNDWWNQIDSTGNQIVAAVEEEVDLEELNKENTNDMSNSLLNVTGMSAQNKIDRKPVKMTPSLEILQASRASRTEKEVEDEFRQMAADKKGKQPAAQKTEKKTQQFDHLLAEDAPEGFSFARERSVNLLLQSQLEIMHEVFERLDKYNEGILRRSDFVMGLRTDPRVIDFIDADAVKKAYSNSTLTLDAVLLEIEKDENYELANKSKDQINHKEFLTWREFLNYFNDYQEIEQRNKKPSEMAAKKTQSLIKKDVNQEDPEAEAAQQIQTLMEQEKERRLQELPKLRPADQIDISEKQLQLIRDIFDTLPRAGGGKDQVNVLTWFITIRKDPQIRAINSAIARDPEGYSRIPRETFQQVFDRMERDLQQKQVDWATIVEFFTKRGRPLSKDEILKLVEEDRKEREAEEHKKRAEEEAERRKNQRLEGEKEEEEDYEAFELRQKAQQIEDMDELERERDGDASERDQEEGEDEMEEEDDCDADELLRATEGFDDDLDQYHTTPSDKGGKTQNLGRTKLSQNDYMKRAHSVKNVKKGKYGVTVPKPFAFDLRDKTKSKSIRERKVEEMIRQKQIEEEGLIKHQFRSKPIPPEVLIPRYNTIMEAEHARRQAVRSQSMHITKSREKPFSFWERDIQKQQAKVDPDSLIPQEMKKPAFKANPIPRACSVLIFEKKMKQDELKRAERIHKNAEISFAKAKMPPTMQKHADRKKQEPPKKLEVEYSFKPDIGNTSPSYVKRIGKILQSRQEKFQRELAKKKGQKTQTEPKSPDFIKRPPKILERPFVNEGGQKSSDPLAEKMKKLAQTLSKQSESASMNPSSTKAAQLSQAKRRQEIQEKRKKEEEIKKAEEDRLKAQNALKGTVQGALKSKFGKSAELIVKEKVAQKRKEMREETLKNKQAIQEMVNKGRQRPMLHETSASDHKANSNLAYIKAAEKMIELLKKNGEDPDKYLPEKMKELYKEQRLKDELKELRDKQKK